LSGFVSAFWSGTGSTFLSVVLVLVVVSSSANLLRALEAESVHFLFPATAAVHSSEVVLSATHLSAEILNAAHFSISSFLAA
tara:strand:+ start:299 stop:544 length:246 start_codon:yes stop_codon:yes gene_type:complete